MPPRLDPRASLGETPLFGVPRATAPHKRPFDNLRAFLYKRISVAAFREDSMAATPSPDALPGLAVLEQTPIIIEKIVWAASDEQLHWKPAADRWSISEVLAHLADVEVVGFRDRIQLMLEKNNPQLERLRSERRLRLGPLLRHQSPRKSEKILPRARPQPFRVALRSARCSRARRPTRQNRPDHRRPTNERVGVPRPRPHPPDRRTLSARAHFFRHIGPFQQFYTIKP